MDYRKIISGLVPEFVLSEIKSDVKNYRIYNIELKKILDITNLKYYKSGNEYLPTGNTQKRLDNMVEKIQDLILTSNYVEFFELAATMFLESHIETIIRIQNTLVTSILESQQVIYDIKNSFIKQLTFVNIKNKSKIISQIQAANNQELLSLLKKFSNTNMSFIVLIPVLEIVLNL